MLPLGRYGKIKMDFLNFFKNKNILITGHTGFKGSWICIWLSMLGAKVSGYSIGIPTEVSMFNRLNISALIDTDLRGDIADIQALQSAMQKIAPEIVIHLAAQPIVLQSYRKPIETLQTNIMGTACVLEAIRKTDSVRSVLVVTTDKCYQNKEWIWGYREIDALGGNDPYACSKACAELVTQSYISSFFRREICQVATVRAGNVIGGGDWADSRLVPDIIRSVQNHQPVILRHPDYIRPWQHVMEPLYGYLLLCRKLYDNGSNYAGAWNFGPNAVESASVGYVTEKLCSMLGGAVSYEGVQSQPHESTSLRLDCSKAQNQLGWKPLLSLDQSLYLTAEWYQKNQAHENMLDVTTRQLENYMQKLEQQIQ